MQLILENDNEIIIRDRPMLIHGFIAFLSLLFFGLGGGMILLNGLENLGQTHLSCRQSGASQAVPALYSCEVSKTHLLSWSHQVTGRYQDITRAQLSHQQRDSTDVLGVRVAIDSAQNSIIVFDESRYQEGLSDNVESEMTALSDEINVRIEEGAASFQVSSKLTPVLLSNLGALFFGTLFSMINLIIIQLSVRLQSVHFDRASQIIHFKRYTVLGLKKSVLNFGDVKKVKLKIEHNSPPSFYLSLMQTNKNIVFLGASRDRQKAIDYEEKIKEFLVI